MIRESNDRPGVSPRVLPEAVPVPLRVSTVNIDHQYHRIRGTPVLIGLVVVCSLGPAGTLANAQEIPKTCAAVEVRSINISEEPEREVLLEATPEKPAIRIVPPSSATPGTSDKVVTIIATGPVLGSMDSRKLETNFTCTTNGAKLTATITRSADYHGAVQKNVLWRPKLQIVIIPRRPEVIFKTIWKMRLTTGVELNHTRMPPYPEQNYPITVTTIVR